jgi:RHS repeat-associated protein
VPRATSVRVMTDAAGNVTDQRHDYRPFGEDTTPLPAPGADPARFLGQQRDSTKFDQFGARYYSMFQGRFSSVDPGHADANLAAPQSWNAYAYARNNPLRYVDPGGLTPEFRMIIWAPDDWPFGGSIDNWLKGIGGNGGSRNEFRGPEQRGGRGGPPPQTPPSPPTTPSPTVTPTPTQSSSVSSSSPTQAGPATPEIRTPCEAFAAALAAGAADTPFPVLPGVGGGMVMAANFRDTNFPIDGFRESLTSENGRQVYRHIFGAAGSTISNPFLLALGTARDGLEWLGSTGDRRIENAQEFTADLAGFRVGLSMARASITGAEARAQRDITRQLCTPR